LSYFKLSWTIYYLTFFVSLFLLSSVMHWSYLFCLFYFQLRIGHVSFICFICSYAMVLFISFTLSLVSHWSWLFYLFYLQFSWSWLFYLFYLQFCTGPVYFIGFIYFYPHSRTGCILFIHLFYLQLRTGYIYFI